MQLADKNLSRRPEYETTMQTPTENNRARKEKSWVEIAQSMLHSLWNTLDQSTPGRYRNRDKKGGKPMKLFKKWKYISNLKETIRDYFIVWELTIMSKIVWRENSECVVKPLKSYKLMRVDEIKPVISWYFI